MCSSRAQELALPPAAPPTLPGDPRPREGARVGLGLPGEAVGWGARRAGSAKHLHLQNNGATSWPPLKPQPWPGSLAGSPGWGAHPRPRGGTPGTATVPRWDFWAGGGVCTSEDTKQGP